jgi:hypothetical protein
VRNLQAIVLIRCILETAMTAEPDPESVAFSPFQTPFPTLSETHSTRLAQWADSWTQHFRNDSKIAAPGVLQALSPVAPFEEIPNQNSTPLPKSAP